MLLSDFSHHHIEMACTLLETCGRFLFRSPESHLRTSVLLVHTRTHTHTYAHRHRGTQFGMHTLCWIMSEFRYVMKEQVGGKGCVRMWTFGIKPGTEDHYIILPLKPKCISSEFNLDGKPIKCPHRQSFAVGPNPNGRLLIIHNILSVCLFSLPTISGANDAQEAGAAPGRALHHHG